jgi:hypothetical protein
MFQLWIYDMGGLSLKHAAFVVLTVYFWGSPQKKSGNLTFKFKNHRGFNLPLRYVPVFL